MDDSAHIRVQLRSDPCYLAGVRQLVAGVCQRIGMGDTACSQVALAVDEALANVIRHGYGRAADRPIWLSLWPLEKGDGHGPGIRLEIEDEAKQIDVSELKGRALDDPKPGGLGVHIIREVMDEVVYDKRSPCGMRLTMVKYAPCDDPECGPGH
ncbi:MAG: ATP-binding protein [Phycisphaerales bacterium]|nr:ATP-binding protein [Phycisphaerales bacterium]